jgi:DNA polymerase I-like protein with 3'-5' exonuclease and polymerase domains
MPIVNVDVKNLEGCTFSDLAKDKVMTQEIVEKQDLHTNNQTAFNLPSRLVAKRFLFKTIYGATAYGFFTDPDFLFMGYSEKQWQGVLDAFYSKYKGGAAWHAKIVQEAQANKRLTIPSGRYFPFEPIRGSNGHYIKTKDGSYKWPITQIKNYPVQGFGADLVMLARLEARKLMNDRGIEGLLIGTIHDSIVADCPSGSVQDVSRALLDAVESVPKLVKQVWGYDFSVPLTAEASVGPNKKDLVELAY